MSNDVNDILNNLRSEKNFIIQSIDRTLTELNQPQRTSSYSYQAAGSQTNHDTSAKDGLIINCYWNILLCVQDKGERELLREHLFKNINEAYLNTLKNRFNQSPANTPM